MWVLVIEYFLLIFHWAPSLNVSRVLYNSLLYSLSLLTEDYITAMRGFGQDLEESLNYDELFQGRDVNEWL
jgi:hypothetical protein